MISILSRASILAVILSTPAAASPWDDVARRCGLAAEAQLHAQTGCNTCADAWPSAAMCAVRAYYRGQVPEERIHSVIDEIWRERLRAKVCNQCGDPVGDTFRRLNVKQQ